MTAVRKVGTYGPDELANGEFELRWRLYMTQGRPKERRRAFTNKTRAKRYAERLRWAADHAVDRATGKRWGWAADLEPVLLDAAVPDQPDRDETVWRLICDWRSAKWPSLSGEGRSSAAHSLRAMCRTLTVNPDAPVSDAVETYLQDVAFRNGATEPSLEDLRKRHGVDAEDLWAARRWLESQSLPLARLDRTALRRVLGAFRADGQTAATERRYWTNVQSVITWGSDEGRLPVGLASRIGLRPVEPRVLDKDEPVPDIKEMWRFAFACAIAVKPRSYDRWCAVPLVMGGAGLRIGECRALLRRHCRDHPTNGGMWIDVKGNRAVPGTSWTDTGERIEERGTKRRGPTGNTKGRTTFLPRREAEVVRRHLERFVGPGPDAPVFTTARGARMDPSHFVEQVWQPAVELAFPPGHRLRAMGRHAFRHLAATRWLRNTHVPLTTACEWGGWDRPSTMVDFYAAVLPGDQEMAAAAMADS
jgi:integrase